MEIPFVSCLCVTHRKPLMLRRVIDCFRNQSYANRQLVIVYETSDWITANFLNSQQWEDRIKIVEVSDSPIKKTLGELRNISLKEADGQYVCQWDDDDWYDSDRIQVQMDKITQSGLPASILSRWIVFNSVNQKAYLSNRRLWEGSIMCRKDIVLERPYPEIKKGEDSVVIDYLSHRNLLAVIDNVPELYIYVYHGNNTWEASHFEDIFRASSALNPDICAQIIDILSIQK